MRQRINDIWEVDIDGKNIFPYHCGKCEVMIPIDIFKEIATRIDTTEYNAKDEDGNPVPDEIVEKGRD